MIKNYNFYMIACYTESKHQIRFCKPHKMLEIGKISNCEFLFINEKIFDFSKSSKGLIIL